MMMESVGDRDYVDYVHGYIFHFSAGTIACITCVVYTLIHMIHKALISLRWRMRVSLLANLGVWPWLVLYGAVAPVCTEREPQQQQPQQQQPIHGSGQTGVKVSRWNRNLRVWVYEKTWPVSLKPVTVLRLMILVKKFRLTILSLIDAHLYLPAASPPPHKLMGKIHTKLRGKISDHIKKCRKCLFPCEQISVWFRLYAILISQLHYWNE